MFAPCSRMTLVRACSTPGRSNVRTTSASGATGSIGAPLTGLPSRNEGCLCSGACPDSRAQYRPSLRGGGSLPPSGRLLRLPPAVCAHLGPRAAHVHRAPTTRTVLGTVVERPQAPLVAADLEPPPGPLRESAHRRDEQTRRHPADRGAGPRRQQTGRAPVVEADPKERILSHLVQHPGVSFRFPPIVAQQEPAQPLPKLDEVFSCLLAQPDVLVQEPVLDQPGRRPIDVLQQIVAVHDVPGVHETLHERQRSRRGLRLQTVPVLPFFSPRLHTGSLPPISVDR